MRGKIRFMSDFLWVIRLEIVSLVNIVFFGEEGVFFGWGFESF